MSMRVYFCFVRCEYVCLYVCIYGWWPFDSFIRDSVWHASNGPTSVRLASARWSASVWLRTAIRVSQPREPKASEMSQPGELTS